MPIAACPFWYMGLNSVLPVLLVLLLLPRVQVSARSEGKRRNREQGRARTGSRGRDKNWRRRRAPGVSGSRVYESSGRDTGTPDSRAFLIRSPGFNSPFFVPPSSFFGFVWLFL